MIHLLSYLGLLLSVAAAFRFILVLADPVDAGSSPVLSARACVSGGVYLVLMMGTIIGSIFVA